MTMEHFQIQILYSFPFHKQNLQAGKDLKNGKRIPHISDCVSKLEMQHNSLSFSTS